MSLLAHLSLIQACSSPAPQPSLHRAPIHQLHPWQAQSLPHPEQALPAHSIHKGTLLTPSRTPPASSSRFNAVPGDGAGWMLAAVVLQCWPVLMCFVSATAAVKGYFTGSKVLWSWDSSCEASPFSQPPPRLDLSNMQDDFTSGFCRLWASPGQQRPIPALGLVLQVVTAGKQNICRAGHVPLPSLGLGHLPSHTSGVGLCSLTQTQGEQGVQAATLL